MLKRKWYLMAEEGGDSGDGGGGGDAAPAASDDAAPAAAPATPAFTPAATPAATALKAEDQAPKGVWPDAWREQWAKDDAKKMSRISKYSSPEAAFDALIAAQNKISAGQVKDPFPKDGTDADKAHETRHVHLSEDLPPEYFRGLVSETYNPAKNRFEKRTGARNEPLDTWVYAYAATHHPELRLHRRTKMDWDVAEARVMSPASASAVELIDLAQPRSSQPSAPPPPSNPFTHHGAWSFGRR
jgi:hypothetical protein